MRKQWIFGIVMLLLCSFAFAYDSQIWEYSVNPCIGQTWENGTDLTISVLVKACPDNSKTYPPSNCSQVTSKVSIYTADTGLQINEDYWGNFYVSGTEFTYDNWNVNKTGTYGIRIVTKSDDAGDVGDIVDMNFTVDISPIVANTTNISNVVYGDCITEGGGSGGVSVPGSGGDAITAIMDEANEYGFGYTVMWIIIMLVVAIFIWIGAAEYGAISVGVIALVELIMLFIGVYLGFISWLVILFLGLLAAIVLGKKLYDLFNG